MEVLATILISLAAGVHAASYGAYKDCRHESFISRRCVRELVIALGAGLTLALFQAWKKESYLILYLSSFTLSRVATEFFKLNIRTEPQARFRIPTQIHFFGKVIQNRILRVLMGVITPAAIYGLYRASSALSNSLDIRIRGLITGLMVGVADAVGGAYKDGLVEGFYVRKFLKSSLIGPICGFLLSTKTHSALFLVLATIGMMRMFLELAFKICRRSYVPGKFRSMVPLYPSWSEKRGFFLVPYFITWGIGLTLFLLEAF